MITRRNAGFGTSMTFVPSVFKAFAVLANVPRWFASKLEFVLRHVHALAAKSYTFGFQTEALFEGGVALKLDLSAGAEDAMPRQPMTRLSEEGSDLTRSACDTGSFSNRSIG